MRREVRLTNRTLARQARNRQRRLPQVIPAHPPVVPPPLPAVNPHHSHNWPHRFHALCVKCASVAHDVHAIAVHLTTFTPASARRLLSYAGANLDALPVPHASAPFAAHALRTHVLTLPPVIPRGAPVADVSRPILVIPYAGPETQQLHLTGMLNDPALLVLLPVAAVTLCKRTLCVSAYGKSANQLFNSAVRTALDTSTPVEIPCACSDPKYARFCRPHTDGTSHVFSAEIINSLPDSIKELLARGSSFRFNTLATPTAYFENLSTALTHLISSMSVQLGIPIEHFSPWRIQFLHDANLKFADIHVPPHLRDTTNTGVVPPDVLAHGMAALRLLLQFFVLVTVDKLTGAFALVC